MKNEKWEDVTRETKIEHFAGGNGIAIRLTGGGLLSRGGTVVNREGMRWSWVNDFDICIERRVKAPEFKWTPESVAAVDWSQKSDIETLEACVEHYDEQISAGNYEEFGSGDCPACQKHGAFVSRCSDNGPCPLQPHCCDGLWEELNGTKEATLAVRDYIAKKLEELRKPEEATFKVGDRVRHTAKGGGFVVVGITDSQTMPFIIFNSSWPDGHDGVPSSTIIAGGPVSGIKHGHYFATRRDLTHEKVSK